MLFYEDDVKRGTYFCEYNHTKNNFEVVKAILFETGFYAGYSIGDFDLDNKTDIVYGGIDGDVCIIEAKSEHNYSIVWSTNIETSHAYWHTSTNDIDKNGKPEFWVMNTTYSNGYNVTRLTSFEFTVDNEYQPTYRIDFVGVYPLYAGNIQAEDVDNDGTEEIAVCIGDYIFILKHKETSNELYYDLFYMCRNNTPGGFVGITMYDLDNDGYDELLVNRNITRSDGKSKLCTYIFKPDFVVPVINNEITIRSDYELEQNYPNPFNPATTISYTLAENTIIELKVYDILGNEIVILEEGEKSRGRHTVQWNGKDKFQNTVNSGIYFIQLLTPFYNKTIKGVMLK
ncbi:MAG: T9SS type A sorting domain-containing protein, partial [Nitrososphaeraceae archaeon]|nr:T9SS type A sorting domain-containing protein [Nitrososphaeraceae archaeon]